MLSSSARPSGSTRGCIRLSRFRLRNLELVRPPPASARVPARNDQRGTRAVAQMPRVSYQCCYGTSLPRRAARQDLHAALVILVLDAPINLDLHAPDELTVCVHDDKL